MYDRLQEILNDYGIIISRWPEYTFAFENAIADIEKAVVEALDKQYANVVSPLKENMAPKKFGLKYVQKLAKRSVGPYVVPEEKDGRFQTGRRMLPSTFQDKMKEQDTVKEMAKEIQNSQSGEAKKTTEDLDEFMNNILKDGRFQTGRRMLPWITYCPPKLSIFFFFNRQKINAVSLLVLMKKISVMEESEDTELLKVALQVIGSASTSEQAIRGIKPP